MQRSIVPATSDDTQNDVNLTPMLDVVFILLIFFIVVASFVQELGLDLNRSDGHQEPLPVEESILVTIEEDNGIWIEGRQIDPRAVKANLARLHAERPESKLVRSGRQAFVEQNAGSGDGCFEAGGRVRHCACRRYGLTCCLIVASAAAAALAHPSESRRRSAPHSQ